MSNPWTLKTVSEIRRRDHSYLASDDRCLFFLEYTARGGFRAGFGNSFISNLKKPVSRENMFEYQYKIEAIKTAGENFAKAVRGTANEMVCVPVPPSKCRSDPEYDDRVIQILREFERESKCQGHNPLALELVEQKANIRAAHASPDDRPSIGELANNYEICDDELARLHESGRKRIYVVDDMLTTGAHFKAMQKVILNAGIPGVKVIGIFIARRIPSTTEKFYSSRDEYPL